MLLAHPPNIHRRCIHIYAAGIYICMHVAIQTEWLLGCWHTPGLCAMRLCEVVCSVSVCHAFCAVYMRRLWIQKSKNKKKPTTNEPVSTRVCITSKCCCFRYRTPNRTPVLLWILYWPPDKAGYDHELHLWGASGGWWKIWNSGAGEFHIKIHGWCILAHKKNIFSICSHLNLVACLYFGTFL